MKVSLYSIRDHLIGTSFAPMAFLNNAAAERSFRSMAEQANSVVSQNPSDFSMQKVGEFDPETGVLSALEQPEIVFNGSSIAKA